MEISSNPKLIFSKNIDELLDSIQNDFDEGTLDDSIAKYQIQVDELAREYQDDKTLGKIRYKLYEAQSYIDFYQGNFKGAETFINKAVELRGDSFEDAERLRTSIQNNLKQDGPKTSNNQVSIGGWLGYFTFGLFVSLGYSIYNVYNLAKLLSGLSVYKGQDILDTLFFIILAIVQVVAIYFVIKCSRYARNVVIGSLLFTIFAYSFDAGVSNAVYHYLNQSAPSNTYEAFDRTIFFGIIWIIYFSISKRVKRTLVR